MIHFRIFHPLNFSRIDEDRIVKFYARVGPRSVGLVITNCPPSGRGEGHVTSLIFGKYVLMSRTRCKTEISLQWKINRKSYMVYQMAATAVTLNDLEGHTQIVGLFKCKDPSNIYTAFYTISTDSVLAVPLR